MRDNITIEKLENGFEVECLDEKIAEENDKGKHYKNPYKKYAYSTKEEVIAFITAKLDKLSKRGAKAEYDAAFKEAANSK